MTAKVLKGINTIVMVRKLSEASAKDAYMAPYLTSDDFDPSRDSDSTSTKSGNVATLGEIETDFSFEMLDNDDPIMDVLYQSLTDNIKLEFWLVKLDKLDSNKRAYAIYMQGTVSEDSLSADSGDNSTREITVAVDGTPKAGYTTIPDNLKSQIEYVFKGVAKQSDDATGGGVADTEAETPTTSTTQKG